MSYSAPRVLGTDPVRGTAWGAASAFSHHEDFAMASLKIPAWGSDFSTCLGTNESLGFFFPFIAFEGILGKFSVLMGSSGSDFIAIHEGHQEKLDFAGKLGEGGGYPLARCLPAPRHRDQPHPRRDHSHYTAIVGFFKIHIKCLDAVAISTLEMPIELD